MASSEALEHARLALEMFNEGLASPRRVMSSRPARSFTRQLRRA
ncbi:hypothetical protein [Vulcanisaeta sp. JCM 14467]